MQKALQLGLSEGRIRAVTKYHLERYGIPFKCAEELIDAVLDYQREEEQQQSLDGDDDEEQSSSAIVREGKLLLENFYLVQRTKLILFGCAVGRILDTIFNNNHDSSSSSLLSNVLDDFEILETPSHSSQSTSQSSSTSTRSSTEATTATTTSEASTSPRKVTNSQTPTHSMATETAVPESSSNADNDSSSSIVDDTEVSVQP